MTPNCHLITHLKYTKSLYVDVLDGEWNILWKLHPVTAYFNKDHNNNSFIATKVQAAAHATCLG